MLPNYEEILRESLRDWFKKENWVRINTSGNITGPCGTMKKVNQLLDVYLKRKHNHLLKPKEKLQWLKKFVVVKKENNL